MDCYVAGRTSDIERVNIVQAIARSKGHIITFDWTGPEGAIRKSWKGHEEQGSELSQREVAAAKCELFILCTPPYRTDGGVGCFIEFGIALGHGAFCLVFPFLDRDSVFFHHPNVHIVRDYTALGTALQVVTIKVNVPQLDPFELEDLCDADD